jgi:hypothetical protein
MSNDIKYCNYKVQDENTYYNSLQAELDNTIGSMLWYLICGIFWSFFTVLFLIIFAISQSSVILVFAFLFSALAIWYFYLLSTLSKNTITEESISSATLERPCKNLDTNIVYN